MSVWQSIVYMVKENYSKEDIDSMAKNLHKEGWESHHLLPEGWFMRPEKFRNSFRARYISDDFRLFDYVHQAVKAMRSNGQCRLTTMTYSTKKTAKPLDVGECKLEESIAE